MDGRILILFSHKALTDGSSSGEIQVSTGRKFFQLVQCLILIIKTHKSRKEVQMKNYCLKPSLKCTFLAEVCGWEMEKFEKING